MDRPLAIGGAGGAASSILVSILRGLLLDHHPEVPLNLPCECPRFDFELEDLPWATFALGLACGIALGPLIDLLWILRQRWRRFIWRACVSEQRDQQVSRPLYKVVA